MLSRAFLASCVLFTVKADPYNESEALIAAYLSTAAYCGYPKESKASLEAWNCGPACDAVPGMTQVRQIIQKENNDAFAYVGKRDGNCLLAFRGTSDLAGWISDLGSLSLTDLTAQGVACHFNGVPCMVGDGFMKNYNSISNFVKSNLSDIGCTPGMPLTVTGHSLGASEATIAMFDLAQEGYDILHSYTFGQPRTGDAVFAQAFEALLGKTIQHHVTYHKDPIPHSPASDPSSSPYFKHPSTEVFYNGDVADGYVICDGSGEDKTCSDQYTDVFEMDAACVFDSSGCDHLLYMTALKTIPMDGSSCTDSATLVV